MSFNPDPSKQAQNFFLLEKLRRFLIFHFALITALSWKTTSKTPWEVSCCLTNIWGTLESNYCQGRQSYRTVTNIVKKSAETVVNNYVRSFSETTYRLRWHDLWWSLKRNISPETWVFLTQCLPSPIRSY